MLDTRTPHPCILELRQYRFVDASTQLHNGRVSCVQDDGCAKIRDGALGLGEDPRHLASLPDLL